MNNSRKISAQDLDEMKLNLMRCDLRALHGIRVSAADASGLKEYAEKCALAVTLVPSENGQQYLFLVDVPPGECGKNNADSPLCPIQRT